MFAIFEFDSITFICVLFLFSVFVSFLPTFCLILYYKNIFKYFILICWLLCYMSSNLFFSSCSMKYYLKCNFLTFYILQYRNWQTCMSILVFLCNNCYLSNLYVLITTLGHFALIGNTYLIYKKRSPYPNFYISVVLPSYLQNKVSFGIISLQTEKLPLVYSIWIKSPER